MMKKTYIAATAALLLSGSVFAETVATVNGTKIDSSELDNRVNAIVQESKGQVQDTPDLRRYVAEQIVVETVVSQEAKRLHLENDAEYKAALAESRKLAQSQGLDKQAGFKQRWAAHENQMLMTAFARDVVKKNPVTDAQVQANYDEMRKRYENTDEVQLGEIITDKLDDAKAAVKDLGKKKSFADVAKKYSLDAKNGGEVNLGGYLPLVDLQESRPQIYQAVANLGKGQFSQPIVSEKIQAVFYVNDKRKMAIPAFDAVKEGMRGVMQQERVQAAIDQLMGDAKIVPVSK
ncbi:peptidyl-prolyl cis-trans isomerase [Kingella negevensis]|uniref:peptidyl-prolyl cis-trans isomerase n=2 Tax=Kingella negevensis TaxID=1522312 RepID=UPI00069374D4|nr:peptidyl-prolyl cis-trans isomerase [Kingella negevensis]MDK4688554.1 peptidyl-prolyl cis-trans isomerase [Kingella negevensis]